MARVIDGKACADSIRGELASRVAALSAQHGRAPGLAVLLVGARPDSATYVRMKKKACAEAGILDFGVDLPADASQADIIAAVDALNSNAAVDGILVQVRRWGGGGVGWKRGGRSLRWHCVGVAFPPSAPHPPLHPAPSAASATARR